MLNLFRSNMPKCTFIVIVRWRPRVNEDAGRRRSDDCLYVSLLFREINAENLSDEDTELIEEKDDEKCLNVDEVVMDISDILERLASANIQNEKISKFNICRSNICDGVFRGMTS